MARLDVLKDYSNLSMVASFLVEIPNFNFSNIILSYLTTSNNFFPVRLHSLQKHLSTE